MALRRRLSGDLRSRVYLQIAHLRRTSLRSYEFTQLGMTIRFVDHWPQWDDLYLQSATMTIVVQVNELP